MQNWCGRTRRVPGCGSNERLSSHILRSVSQRVSSYRATKILVSEKNCGELVTFSVPPVVVVVVVEPSAALSAEGRLELSTLRSVGLQGQGPS